MKANYERILSMAVEDGVQNGLHSLKDVDLENLNEDELICTFTKHVMDEIAGWISLGEGNE